MTTEYTVLIETGSDDGQWQATAPAETVDVRAWGPSWTAEDVAIWAANNQTRSDAGRWRVRVWEGADADTSSDPAAVHEVETVPTDPQYEAEELIGLLLHGRPYTPEQEERINAILSEAEALRRIATRLVSDETAPLRIERISRMAGLPEAYNVFWGDHLLGCIEHVYAGYGYAWRGQLQYHTVWGDTPEATAKSVAVEMVLSHFADAGYRAPASEVEAVRRERKEAYAGQLR